MRMRHPGYFPTFRYIMYPTAELRSLNTASSSFEALFSISNVFKMLKFDKHYTLIFSPIKLVVRYFSYEI